MEEWQRQHIQKNQVELIKCTRYSSELGAWFVQKGILSEGERNWLEQSHLSSFQKSSELYKILQTKTDSFEVTVELLGKTNQSGAVKILRAYNTIYKNYGSISFDKNHILGTGAFGTKVYQGSFGGRNVAVKVINTNIVELDVALREVNFLKKFDEHENILRYYTAEVSDDFIYIALELCHISLSDKVKMNILKIEPVPVLRMITAGLAHLHKNNTIHGDLKPANVLLKENGQAKLSDFGLSIEIPEGVTSVSIQTGGAGTVEYTAPEILLESEGTARRNRQSVYSDVFSLGCIFHFVLTKGRHPFGTGLYIQVNICEGNWKLQLTESEKKLWGLLIETMISLEASCRPSAEEILEHKGLAQIATATGKTTRVGTEGDAAYQNKPLLTAGAYSAERADKSISRNAVLMEVKRRQHRGKTFLSKPNESGDLAEKENSLKLLSAVTICAPVEEIQALVAAGANWRKLNWKQQTVLHIAAAQGNNEVIQYFCKIGAEIDCRDYKGELPLHKINVQNGNWKSTFLTLLTLGSDVNAENSSGETILHKMAKSPHVCGENLKFIMSKGGEAKWQGNGKLTALHFAVARENIDVIEFLLACEADVNATDESGSFPIHLIQPRSPNFSKTVEMLLAHGASVNATNLSVYTPLTSAVMGGASIENIEFLVSKGANLECKDYIRRTLLHHAVEAGNVDAIKYFVVKRADVNAYSSLGSTPVHSLCKSWTADWDTFITALGTLIEFGAVINAIDDDGSTALDIAISREMPMKVLNYITARGGRDNIRQRCILM